MRYVVLAPFYNPDPSFEFATEEEAEAFAHNLLANNPNQPVRTAQLLKSFSAEVKVNAAAIKADPAS
ncbi:hypothetical protein NS337_03370 [Pseudomonas oryzihabitans]|uniref:hypothetical protein n=1 Tax=Pseudomonas oryzihabitans TaxID=47885 RepID=UPI00073622B9|nr:hypothetical protein [Pseudomonas psychrotolerans]KTT56390.1 hypothetical protein NS337_03370 [Pseudomonas psychrotolerans]